MINKIEDCFNKMGDFIDPNYDPYRQRNEIHEIHKFLFKQDDKYNIKEFLKEDIKNNLAKCIAINNYSPFSDAVALYHSDIFANNTKNNYSTIYYWR